MITPFSLSSFDRARIHTACPKRFLGCIRGAGAVAMLLVALSLASWVEGGSGLSPQALQQRGLKAGEGLIVGTYEMKAVTRTGETPSHGGMVTFAGLMAKPAGSRGQPTIAMTSKVRSQEGGILPGLNDVPSDVFAIPVPAGSYEITGWTMLAQVGPNASARVNNRLPMSVPFQVKAGEATYVGGVRALCVYGKSLIGLPAFGDGTMLLTDDFDKGRSRVTKAYRSIPPASIRRSDAPAAYLREVKRISSSPDQRNWWEKLF